MRGPERPVVVEPLGYGRSRVRDVPRRRAYMKDYMRRWRRKAQDKVVVKRGLSGP